MKDVVDAMGIDWESIKTLKDAEPIFEKVKAEHPEMYMLIADFGDIRRPLRIDSLCDDSCLGVLEDASVSYTHLDVYKRQGLEEAVWAVRR